MNPAWRGAVVLLCLCIAACTEAPRGGWDRYPNLSPRIYVGDRWNYDIDGRAIRSGPAVTSIGFEPYPSAIPIVRVRLSDEKGRERVVADAVVDTGWQGSLGLSNRAARRAGVWLWPEARGQERFWSLGQGEGSLGIAAALAIGESTLSGIPANVHSGEAVPVTLGLDLLRCWPRAELDFAKRRLILRTDAAPPSQPGVTISFDWWDAAALPGKGEQWVKDHGFMVVQATVNGAPIDLIVDTGTDADLAVPMSLVFTSPWREALDSEEVASVQSAHTTSEVRTASVVGSLCLGGAPLTGLTAIIIDDSTLPPGHAMPALLGVSALRRYKSVEFDFASQSIRLRE